MVFQWYVFLSLASNISPICDFYFIFIYFFLQSEKFYFIFILFYLFIFISWRLIILQYCSGFCHTLTWISHGFPCVPHPSGSSQCTSLGLLSHASNLDWWCVSPLIVYLFQCCYLRTSHLRLLPQSPKVCSIHLCFFFCFTHRVIVTIFLNPIYICLVYCIGVYLSGLLHPV